MTGKELRAIRKRSGLTQADLADLVGVATNSVARWERGEMAIRESAARLISLLAEQKSVRRIGKPNSKRGR